MFTLLVVSEDPERRNQLQDWLSQEGFKVPTAKDIRTGLSKLLSEQPGLTIIHISGEKNLQALIELAARMTPYTIVLSDDPSNVEASVALCILGADFYEPDSLGKSELTARINALLRRATLVA